MSAVPSPPVQHNAQRQLTDWEKRAEELAERKRAYARIFNAVVRGGGAGFAIRGGVNLVSLLLSLSAKGRKRSRSAKELAHDTARYTAFLGALGGAYVLLEETIAALFGKERTSKYRALVAGLLCGPTLLLTGREARHTSLSVYVLLRGLVLLVRCGNKASAHPLLRKALAPTRWQHGDTAIMCASTVQLAYSWLFLQQTLPTSYVRFLNKHGGKQLEQYAALKEVCKLNTGGGPPRPLAALQGTALEQVASPLPCRFVHPGTTCSSHTLTFFPRAYLNALPVYLPVYVVPALLVHRQKLLRGPQAAATWRKVGLGVARSSAFLALFCTLAWTGVCAGFQATGTATVQVVASTCWVAGLATLVEKKSRRMELALYCMSRAVESFALCLGEWGWVRRSLVPKRLDVVLFSAAVGCIMHCYSDSHGAHRDVFTSKYLSVLDFIFGNQGMEAGKIRHVPSTGQMLNTMATSKSFERLQLLAQRHRRGSAPRTTSPRTPHKPHDPSTSGGSSNAACSSPDSSPEGLWGGAGAHGAGSGHALQRRQASINLLSEAMVQAAQRGDK